MSTTHVPTTLYFRGRHIASKFICRSKMTALMTCSTSTESSRRALAFWSVKRDLKHSGTLCSKIYMRTYSTSIESFRRALAFWSVERDLKHALAFWSIERDLKHSWTLFSKIYTSFCITICRMPKPPATMEYQQTFTHRKPLEYLVHLAL